LRDLVITKVAVGRMDNNAYLLRCRDTDDLLLIDAAAEPRTLIRLVGPSGLGTAVTTHRHQDHWSALAAIVDEFEPLTAAGRADADGIDVETDELLDDGSEVVVGSTRLEVIHLVGHTPGSIALLYDDPYGHPHLFTGDSLFPGGVGNTQQDPERFGSLIDDVEERLFGALPDETWVYPGHGADTTLGAERPSLADWRRRGW
jgi:glyoxylase-like metal-dependent hydrolase (beta-lactamase superfamily II)